MSSVASVSLSQQSTGEVRLWISSLSGCESAVSKVDLVVAQNFLVLFSDYPGKVISNGISKTRLTVDDVKICIASLCEHYNKIVFLDLTSICLENRFSLRDIEELVGYLASLAKSGLSVYLFDPMGVMEDDIKRYRNRRDSVKDECEQFITEYNRKVGPSANYRSYYFGRYLKDRTLNQVVLIPDPLKIIRCVPYNDPRLSDSKAILHYHMKFEEFDRSQDYNNKKVLIALSKFASNVIDREMLSELVNYVLICLYEECQFDNFVVIDPMNLELKSPSRASNLNVYERMPRDKFLNELSDVALCSAFIPTSTVGVAACQNGIPFVSFFSSMFSDEFLKESRGSEVVPRFTSLGIWEDFAFLNHLRKNEGSYLRTVEMVDISHQSSFARLSRMVGDGTLVRNLARLSNISEASNLVALPELLEV